MLTTLPTSCSEQITFSLKYTVVIKSNFVYWCGHPSATRSHRAISCCLFRWRKSIFKFPFNNWFPWNVIGSWLFIARLQRASRYTGWRRRSFHTRAEYGTETMVVCGDKSSLNKKPKFTVLRALPWPPHKLSHLITTFKYVNSTTLAMAFNLQPFELCKEAWLSIKFRHPWLADNLWTERCYVHRTVRPWE